MVSLSMYGKCSSCGKKFSKGGTVVMTGRIAGAKFSLRMMHARPLDSPKVYCMDCAKKLKFK